MNKQHINQEFDYIIVGAGSSGCVIANRLVRKGYSVLLLEAGVDDKNIFIHIPIGYYKTIFNKKLSWNYWTEEIPNLNRRKIFWPRGKVLGGCSAINGLVYVQGQPEDFNSWQAQGNVGWGWNSLHQYFKQIKEYNPLINEEEDSFNFSKIEQPHPLCDKFIKACESAGIQKNYDFNGIDQEGCGYFKLAVKNGMRCSSATAFIRPIRNNPNFKLSLKSFVTKILFDSSKKKSVGVEYYKNNNLLIAKAKKEIILSAGAINSPKILQLSGIGDGNYLRDLGVEVIKNLPGVGKNLQDHYQARLIYATKHIDSLNLLSRRIPWKIRSLYQYLLNKTGPLAIGAAQAGAFIKSSSLVNTPDLQLHFIPLSVDVPGEALHSFSGVTISVCQLRPKSRGYVKITSSNAWSSPLIQPNYFSDPSDMVTTIQGMKICRHIFKQKPISEYIESEFEPSAQYTKDKELVKFIKERGTTIFHPVGTCKMGIDEDAVVDNNLKIYGIEGLRVADASIMPTLISGNTNASVIVIGKKASDLILSEVK